MRTVAILAVALTTLACLHFAAGSLQDLIDGNCAGNHAFLVTTNYTCRFGGVYPSCSNPATRSQEDVMQRRGGVSPSAYTSFAQVGAFGLFPAPLLSSSVFATRGLGARNVYRAENLASMCS